MNIYVSNLDFGVTENNLSDLFKEFGAVSSAKLILDRATGRSRGFGFVEMDLAEEANNAIDKLHNHEVNGRAISVVVARDKAPRSSNGFY